MQVYKALTIIALLWGAYFFIRYGLAKTKVAVTLERQLRGIIKHRLFGGKVPRLCGYHLGALNSPGQLAVVDSLNCELCKAPAYARHHP